MKQVFLSGSRRIGRLNDTIRAQLDSAIDESACVLVGDANGADRVIQQYLADRGHTQVLVHCSGRICRNNVGGWAHVNVASDRTRMDFEFYRAKDQVMCEQADTAIMLWDGMSRGTLYNLIEVIRREKPVLVYYEPERAFIRLSGFDEFERFLERCGSKARETAAQLIGRRPAQRDRQLALDLG